MFAGTVFTFDLPPVVAHFTTTAAFSLCVTGLIFWRLGHFPPKENLIGAGFYTPFLLLTQHCQTTERRVVA